MKVRILRAGKYSDFSTPPRVKSQRLAVGDEVEFPGQYAKGLFAKNYAEPVEKEMPIISPKKGVWIMDVTPTPEDASEPEIDATPGAVKLAEEKGLDLHYITGTGRDGRITAKDVREAMSGASA